MFDSKLSDEDKRSLIEGFAASLTQYDVRPSAYRRVNVERESSRLRYEKEIDRLTKELNKSRHDVRATEATREPKVYPIFVIADHYKFFQKWMHEEFNSPSSAHMRFEYLAHPHRSLLPTGRPDGLIRLRACAHPETRRVLVMGDVSGQVAKQQVREAYKLGFNIRMVDIPNDKKIELAC